MGIRFILSYEVNFIYSNKILDHGPFVDLDRDNFQDDIENIWIFSENIFRFRGFFIYCRTNGIPYSCALCPLNNILLRCGCSSIKDCKSLVEASLILSSELPLRLHVFRESQMAMWCSRRQFTFCW